jgi:hypothetical protein
MKIDGLSYTTKTSDAVSFMKSNGAWTVKKFTPGLTAKQQGAEGPLYTAVISRHVYVYGTAGDPSKEELMARRMAAVSATDWTGMGGRIMVFPRVISDKEVRASDYVTSNLILFGTRETNAVIEKFTDNLPMHLKADESDYGLVYIFPLNRHYVLINSGLPWWTPSAKDAREGGYAVMGSRVEALKKFQDFVLFKESPDNIVTQGLFDNSWKLPQKAADELKASGVVTVR